MALADSGQSIGFNPSSRADLVFQIVNGLSRFYQSIISYMADIKPTVGLLLRSFTSSPLLKITLGNL